MVTITGICFRKQVYDVMRLLGMCNQRRLIAGFGTPRKYYSKVTSIIFLSYSYAYGAGSRGGGGQLPQFSQKYQLVGQFLLKSWAIFLFMFCFTNILNIFFSFVTCSMHKNPHQNAGMALKRLYFSNYFRAFGTCRANSCPSPQNF